MKDSSENEDVSKEGTKDDTTEEKKDTTDAAIKSGFSIEKKQKKTKRKERRLISVYSRERLVNYLLSKETHESSSGVLQQTAVHTLAARRTRAATSLLKTLLETTGNEAKLELDEKGRIPLLLAVEAGNQSMCRELLTTHTAEQLKSSAPPHGDTALHIAVRHKDVNLVRILINYGAGVDIRNGEGQTPLHIACAEGNEILVKYFHSVHASVDMIDNLDRTPMHVALQNGHAKIIELLADKFKASIFERTKNGSTLLHIAANKGYADCVTMLYEKGLYLHMPNKDGSRSIHIAAKYGHVQILNILLKKGESPDVPNNDNYTPLHIGVESANPAVVETLLGYGANVHATGGKFNETALHIAAKVKDGDRCALMLLKSGASASTTALDDQTPVHVAAQYGNLETLKLLLEEGGNLEFKNKWGETALHLASKGCRRDVVEYLINCLKERKGDEAAAVYINQVNEKEETALHYVSAVHKDDVEINLADKEVVKILLDNGANAKLRTKQHESVFHFVAKVGNNDVLMEMVSHLTPVQAQEALNRQNIHGWTPLLIACHKGHEEMVLNLLSNSARVNVFDNEGRSALHLAAEHGSIEVCDAVLAKKVFINSKSKNGSTALHLAAMNGYIDLVKFLIQKHKATINTLTIKKQTPLHLAAAAGQVEVCSLLLELGANIDAVDELGEKPIHEACHNNYSAVVKLFLQRKPTLVMSTTKDGSTCAHIAASRGSVTVIEELMRFNKAGVITAKDRISGSTALQIAAEGGHGDVVDALVNAGASVVEENKSGFTALHLAAKKGNGTVLETLRSSTALRVNSKKLGVTPLHVAAYFGQADTVRELLTHVPSTVKSEPPHGTPLIIELGNESEMTPLHFASFSGSEDVVRLLLNSPGVQMNAKTHENGYNPMHLACFGGHITVVGLLISRSAELLQSRDRQGRTSLHIAATNGHSDMVEVLLGQGAEINARDRGGWTPLHCASKAGCLDVVQLLTGSGATPKSETVLGLVPLWFAVSEGHHEVLLFLFTKEHDTYALMDDREFVYNLMDCSTNHNNKPIEEFVLVSQAPVHTAAKLSNIFMNMSRQKEREREFIAAAKFCEGMATDLLALAAGPDSAGKLLIAIDKRNMQLLDVLIENEQKEVIAHVVVQQYLVELWRGGLKWGSGRMLLLFALFVLCPPVWLAFTLPLGHKYYSIPIIRFMTHLTSHIYLLLFLILAGITPPYPVLRKSLLPYSYEWILLVWLSGLLLFELSNPSKRSVLGYIKLSVLLCGVVAVALHVMGILLIIKSHYWPTLMYCRNQFIALSFLLACIQILDFLSFHHLFGPWAVIIGNLMRDLARYLAVLALFLFGFSMQFVALNQPFRNGRVSTSEGALFGDVQKSPFRIFELLLFAVFGQTEVDTLKTDNYSNTKNNNQPTWTEPFFKILYGVYMLVSVIVLINLLIAMMTDTYQRIQAQSDIEWRFGLSKLIRAMHRSTSAPSPINLITTWFFYLVEIYKKKAQQRKNIFSLMGNFRRPLAGPKKKIVSRWLSLRKKGCRDDRKESVAESVTQQSSVGSEMSLTGSTIRIEDVADWEAVARKYRAMMGTSNEEVK